ncbi:MAG: RidA family protein [Candidatus Eremiobacteraeota bacterium]|nr:RidA family protein [Candidatus Eremiobacteraeota bacterium]
MSREIVQTNDAPAPIGPYSQAIKHGKELFCSGQIPLDPKTMNVIEGDVAVQTEQVCKNLSAVLSAAGYSFDDIVKTTIFLIDMNDFQAMNEVYAKYFGNAKPARSTVAVAGLPRGARVEIDCIARKVSS